jgi:hypothetical protein
MAVNTYKEEYKKEVKPKKESVVRKNRMSFFRFLENYLRTDGIFEQGLPIRYIPHILFVTAAGILYIGNIHYAEKTIRKLNRLKIEVDDLRADYTTMKAEYMYASKQSEVANKVAKMGIFESSVPPHKIILKKEE